MTRTIVSLLFLFAFACAQAGESERFGIAIHGGAGTIPRETMTPEREAAYHAALQEALRTGSAILEEGGTALDAVTAAVRVLEDNPLFNAGRGAVFTADERNELDAAIMDGATLNAGAVAAVTRIRHPVDLARAVMERSPHVLLIGAGAEAFAAEQGFEFVDPSWFRTDERLQQLRRAQEARRNGAEASLPRTFAFGTVGAVALDRDGNLAAATSTGGMTNKRWGRVGDVPVIGAGTYAENATAAISATGHGEYFIRSVVAHEIAARMRLQGKSLRQAADEVVMGLLVERGGEGGIIAIDREANVTMPFNSSGMYRGYLLQGSELHTAIFAD